MLKLRLAPAGVAGRTLEVFMIKCAMVYSSVAAVASMVGAFYLGASAVVVWCFLTVPVVLFIVIMSGFKEREKESESG